MSANEVPKSSPKSRDRMLVEAFKDELAYRIRHPWRATWRQFRVALYATFRGKR